MPAVPKPPPRGRKPKRVPPDVYLEVMDRAKGQCERCAAGLDLELHHKKKRSQGGKHTAKNCVALCVDCHGWVESHPEAATAEGWTVPSWA